MGTKIISAFPGTGKTYFAEHSKLDVLDSDSSRFSWSSPGVREENFPQNYIEHIVGNIGKVDVILVSSHKEVRDALIKAGITFFVAYPLFELKDEYLDRFKMRGSPASFVELMSNKWEAFLFCISDTPVDAAVLGYGEYLSDVFEKAEQWFANASSQIDNGLTKQQGDVTMELTDFSWALRLLKQGKQVSRKSWDGPGQWIRMYDPHADNEMPIRETGNDLAFDSGTMMSWFGLHNTQNQFFPWVPSMGDLMAEDWIEVG